MRAARPACNVAFLRAEPCSSFPRCTTIACRRAAQRSNWRHFVLVGRFWRAACVQYLGICGRARPKSLSNIVFSPTVAVQPISDSTSKATVELAGASPSWTRRERFRLDGVRYDVYVATRNGGYCGVWVCIDCGEHGCSPVNDATAEEAHSRAKISLCDHHKNAHRRPCKPK